MPSVVPEKANRKRKPVLGATTQSRARTHTPRRCVTFRRELRGNEGVGVQVVVRLRIFSQRVQQACACLLL